MSRATGTARRSALVGLLCVVLPSLASADDPYEIIVTDDSGVPAVAGSATVLDEDDLQRFEHDDIHAILTEAPGVYTRDEDGFGLRPNIGIRGANSERSSKVMLLEDGVPLVPAPYAAPAAYYFPMATRLVGVEVFKGPAATQYGPQTVGGAINLRTRDVPVGLDGGLDLAIGLRNTVKLHAWTGGGSEDRGILVEGVHLATDGFKTLPDDAPTGFDRTDVMVKLRQVMGNHTVQLKLGLAREDSHETYTGLIGSDADDDPYRRYAATALDRMQWTRTQAELSHTLQPSHRMDVHTTAYHHYLQRSWFKLNRFADGPALHDLLTGQGTGRDAVYMGILRGESDTSAPGEALLIGDNDRSYHSMGVQSRLRVSEPWGTGRIRAEVGVRLHHDVVDRLHTEDSFAMVGGELVRDDTPRATNTDSRSLATAVASHALVELERGDWHLFPSARVEHVRTEVKGAPPESRTTLLPGVGLRWEAMSGLDLFTGVHRGFSPVAPGQSKEVRPEISVNGELGMRLSSATGQLEVVGFVSDYTNLVGDCTFSAGCQDDTIGQQFNAGEVLISGLELMGRNDIVVSPALTVPVQANYTLTDGTFQSDFVSTFPQYGSVSAGDHLPYVPTHQASMRAGVHATRWSVDVGVTARSALRDAARDAIEADIDVPALALLNASGTVSLDEHITLYTTVTNALNSQQTVSLRPYGARPVAPMQVMFGVKAR